MAFQNFDVNNINAAQMAELRKDVYGGYRKKASGAPRYEMRGAGSGRRSVQTGYHAPGTSFSYYNNHAGWSGVRDKLGINDVNNTGEISRMYDYINGYQAPATAAAAPAAGPSSQGTSSINFSNQLAAIKAQNQASINALTKQMSDQKADYDARELAANKKISNLSSTVANAQSQYDPTKDMGSSNNINPALTIQEKSKSLSSGTERYNRNKLSINNVNV